jgi:predicted ribosomally synthesized peptide with nif11-like leader
MSQENFERFRQIVLEDLSLQERLRAIEEREPFVSRVVEMGAECGIEFTAEDVREAIRANRRAWIERWI